MSTRSSVLYATGEAGAGKTLDRVQKMIQFMIEGDGHVYCNLPLGEVPTSHAFPPRFDGEHFTHRIAKRVCKGKGIKVNTEDIANCPEIKKQRDRIHLIPEDELNSWNDYPRREPKDQEGLAQLKGLWSYLEGKNLSGALIVLDEVHNWYGKEHPKWIVKRLQVFLGEVRHMGAAIEFISQTPHKVAREIDHEAGSWIEIHSSHHARDPYIKIPMHDWHELIASITRSWQPMMYVDHYAYRNSRKVRVHTEKIRIIDTWFAYYNSFSAPHQDGQAGNVKACEWEKHSRLYMLFWFLRRNLLELSKPALIFAALFWLVVLGGGQFLMGRIVNMGMGLGKRDVAAHVESSDTGGTDELLSSPGNPPNLATPQLAGQTRQTEQSKIYEEKLARQAEEARLLKEKLARANRDMDRMSAVSMMLTDSVVFRNGEHVRLDNEIKFGTFKGLTIESIDYPQRTVYLSDGSVLRLGRVQFTQDEQPAATIPVSDIDLQSPGASEIDGQATDG